MKTNITPNIQKLTNSIARKAGYNKANYIVLGNKNSVISHTNYGYRKISTD